MGESVQEVSEEEDTSTSLSIAQGTDARPQVSREATSRASSPYSAKALSDALTLLVTSKLGKCTPITLQNNQYDTCASQGALLPHSRAERFHAGQQHPQAGPTSDADDQQSGNLWHRPSS